MQPISFSIGYPQQQPVYHKVREEGKKDQESMTTAIRRGVDSKMMHNAVKLANLRDEELLSLSKALVSKDDKYKQKTYAAMLLAIPALDTVLSTFSKNKSKLSGRLATMGKTAGLWAGAFALGGLYDGAIKKVEKVCPKAKEKSEEHPVISSILRLAGFAGVLYGSYKGIGKLKNVLPKKFPGVMKDMKVIKNKVAATVNGSKFNEKIIKPIKEQVCKITDKHQKIAGGISAIATLAVPFLAIGTIFKVIADKAEHSQKVKDTYKKLSATRDFGRRVVDALNPQHLFDEMTGGAKPVQKAQNNIDAVA